LPFKLKIEKLKFLYYTYSPFKISLGESIEQRSNLSLTSILFCFPKLLNINWKDHTTRKLLGFWAQNKFPQREIFTFSLSLSPFSYYLQNTFMDEVSLNLSSYIFHGFDGKALTDALHTYKLHRNFFSVNWVAFQDPIVEAATHITMEWKLLCFVYRIGNQGGHVVWKRNSIPSSRVGYPPG